MFWKVLSLNAQVSCIFFFLQVLYIGLFTFFKALRTLSIQKEVGSEKWEEMHKPIRNEGTASPLPELNGIQNSWHNQSPVGFKKILLQAAQLLPGSSWNSSAPFEINEIH